ncbi:hypothetical protein Fcan01_21830 [Folsomia candida]|uniref:C-type lectin domain-containing protein n=1 Tax=Folsomia candida TaxID=158441 RepID=A0A226DDC0_FOLCA|nr:hypothetical protein Fcan01_21830 [Folsomia candida]
MTKLYKQVRWLNAFNVCNQLEGRLVAPMNPELDDNLREFLVVQNFTGRIWLGARVTGGRWIWETNNVPMSWSNFRNEANCDSTSAEVCLEGRTPSETEPGWDWCGRQCDTELPFVCQFECEVTITTPTTTVVTTTARPISTSTTTVVPISTSSTTPVSISTSTSATTISTSTTPVPISTTPTTIQTTLTTTTLTTTPPPFAPYVLMNSTNNWLAAFEECNRLGGGLVTPMNPELDNKLREFLITQDFTGTLWLGARVTDGIWKWETNNVPMSWSNFENGPNCRAPNVEHCLEGRRNLTWRWCGVPCTGILNFVCQFDPAVTTRTTPSTTPSTFQPEPSSSEGKGLSGRNELKFVLAALLVPISCWFSIMDLSY